MKTMDLVDRKSCCNCKLCAWECPKGAIRFVSDEYGFSYPQIDENLCINCGKCVKCCPAGGAQGKKPEYIYAAAHGEEALLNKSASGGIFAAIAKTVLSRGGIVYGAALEKDAKLVLKAKHIRINALEELEKLQGSKYVQSDMEGIFPMLAEDLKKGLEVVFSGTPCQIAAVKAAFGERENLLLIDIICHGVPSQQMFSDYLLLLKKKYPQIENFYFRSKDSGWGLCAKLKYIDKTGKEKFKLIPCDISSYYKLFLQSVIYRESCYQCPYAKAERIADITLGDYWGVEKIKDVYDLLVKADVDITKGVSCVLACTERGKKYVEESGAFLASSDFDSVAAENMQIIRPSFLPGEREYVFAQYRESGFYAVDKSFCKKLGNKKYIILLKNKISPKWKVRIKKLLGR